MFIEVIFKSCRLSSITVRTCCSQKEQHNVVYIEKLLSIFYVFNTYIGATGDNTSMFVILVFDFVYPLFLSL